MKILILGAGKMGTFFCDILSFKHEVAVFDVNPQKLRFTFNTQRITWLSCTAHVADHAMITQLPCTGHMTDHALIT